MASSTYTSFDYLDKEVLEMAVLFKWRSLAFLLFGVLYEGVCAKSHAELVKRAFDKGRQAVTERYDVIKPNFHEYDVAGLEHGCRWKMGLMMKPSPFAQYMERHAVFYLAATRYIVQRSSMNPREILSDPAFREEWKTQSAEQGIMEEGGCAGDIAAVKQFCKSHLNERFRTADGLCNNINNPTWGRAGTPHARFLPPLYGDDLNMGDTPRIDSVAGGLLPSARDVSVKVFRHFEFNNHPTHTHMLMAMGQFIDHDLTFTPHEKGQNGADIDCCLKMPNGLLIDRPECFPINVTAGDPHFRKDCLNFARSSPAIQTGCGVSLMSSPDNLPPPGPRDTCALTADHTERCLKAGDERANEILNLGMMHIVFLREHNRIAYKLAKKCRRFRRNNNRLFEETRRIIIGIMQKITFYEFLPEVLGSKTMRKHQLKEQQYRGYDPEVDPSILNEFSTGAFRFGHSLIPNHFAFMNEDLSTDYTKHVSETFFKPIEVQHKDLMKKLLRYLTTTKSHVVDREFSESVQDRLFEDEAGDSFDLVANNIQRGRDHGLASYMEVRRACRLQTVSTFPNLPNMTPENRALLQDVYADVDDIDLFAGGILEKHVRGGVVGPTFACIIGEQFRRLRQGDSFYFERHKTSSREFDTRGSVKRRIGKEKDRLRGGSVKRRIGLEEDRLRGGSVLRRISFEKDRLRE
ncbi:peroxidasin-like [Pecten maximus]|uniref:peroxidasin-like n=1 Tax=Pecten maximus TaxID=6579 RepID=UPI00145827C7|nr:peroxidasin-like [Pecten maximus]